MSTSFTDVVEGVRGVTFDWRDTEVALPNSKLGFQFSPELAGLFKSPPASSRRRPTMAHGGGSRLASSSLVSNHIGQGVTRNSWSSAMDLCPIPGTEFGQLRLLALAARAPRASCHAR